MTFFAGDILSSANRFSSMLMRFRYSSLIFALGLMKIRKAIVYILYALGAIAGVYGTYGFFYHFITDFGIDRLILAPIVLPLYNLPAIILIWVGVKLHK